MSNTKSYVSILGMFILLSSQLGCTKQKVDPDNTGTNINTYGSGKGQMTFYALTSANGNGSISIKVDGANVGTISRYYSSGAANCSKPQKGIDVTYVGSAGSHDLYAQTADGKYYWSATFNVPDGSCDVFKLY